MFFGCSRNPVCAECLRFGQLKFPWKQGLWLFIRCHSYTRTITFKWRFTSLKSCMRARSLRRFTKTATTRDLIITLGRGEIRTIFSGAEECFAGNIQVGGIAQEETTGRVNAFQSTLHYADKTIFQTVNARSKIFSPKFIFRTFFGRINFWTLNQVFFVFMENELWN